MPALLVQDTGTDMDNALGYDANALNSNELCDKQKATSCRNREEEFYNALEETQPITVADGSVTFCQHFKYLGSLFPSISATTTTSKNESLLPPNQWEPSKTSGTPPSSTFGANIFFFTQSH